MVSGSLSVFGGSEPQQAHSPLSTYTEHFYEIFPYYLSIGMTYDQFWNDDPTLTKYYRKADEMRKEQRNTELWLQGAYIYEALCDVAPILHAFAKKGAKPREFTATPYPITSRERRRVAEEKERKIAAKGKRMLEAFMQASKAKAEEKPQPE